MLYPFSRLDLTSANIRDHLKPLENIGLIKLKSKDRAIWASTIKPTLFGHLVAESLHKSAGDLAGFL
jgi:hypothetical protein